MSEQQPTPGPMKWVLDKDGVPLYLEAADGQRVLEPFSAHMEGRGEFLDIDSWLEPLIPKAWLLPRCEEVLQDFSGECEGVDTWEEPPCGDCRFCQARALLEELRRD